MVRSFPKRKLVDEFSHVKIQLCILLSLPKNNRNSRRIQTEVNRNGCVLCYNEEESWLYS